jgi:hypothetical protein
MQMLSMPFTDQSFSLPSFNPGISYQVIRRFSFYEILKHLTLFFKALSLPCIHQGRHPGTYQFYCLHQLFMRQVSAIHLKGKSRNTTQGLTMP